MRNEKLLKDTCYFNVIGDKSVMLQELTLGLLYIYFFFSEKKPLLPLLSIGSSSERKVLNKHFKNPMLPMWVCSSNRHTLMHRVNNFETVRVRRAGWYTPSLWMGITSR